MSQIAEVRLYVLKKDGKLEEESLMPFSHYGTCPNVGDTICQSWKGDRRKCYSVQRRYFIDNHDAHPGWVVILREIEISPQITKVVKAWDDDEKFWGEVEEKERAEAYLRVKRLLDAKRYLIDLPLDRLERRAMGRLVEGGTGTANSAKAIPALGPKTQKSLLERGFIRLSSPLRGSGEARIKLTRKGLNAWQRELDHHDRYREDQ